MRRIKYKVNEFKVDDLFVRWGVIKMDKLHTMCISFYKRDAVKIAAALNSKEARPTVRAKRSVQQTKAVKPLCGKRLKCIYFCKGGYCGGFGSKVVSQFGCYKNPAARTAVA